MLVFVVPVSGELDLRAAAIAAGDKRVELLPIAQLVPLTGYERGGVSPVGMKKAYPTVFDETAQLFDRIAISGGMKGITLLVDPFKGRPNSSTRASRRFRANKAQAKT